MDPPELEKARRFMQEKIFQFLAQRQPQTNDIPYRKILDLVKRLEEGLFRAAETQEEYLNLDTLESRIHVIIGRPPQRNASVLADVTRAFPAAVTISEPAAAETGGAASVGP